MRFSNLLLSSSAFAASYAASVTFHNLDSTTRTLYFSENPGCSEIPELTLTGFETKTQEFDPDWQGNWFSVSDGSEYTPGVLGEVTFQDGGDTFFDVSCIVNPNDNEGVRQIWPAHSQRSPMAGCEDYSTQCPNAYYAPNDVQTKGTQGVDLISTLGTKPPSTSSRRSVLTQIRDFVATVLN